MHTIGLVAITLAVMAQLVVLLYPGHRLATWFEFLTDGYMPEALANLAQDTLARLWIDGFDSGAVQRDEEVSNAISSYIRKTSSNLIIELAAGGGVVSVLWGEHLREHDDAVHTQILLTDLQPNPVAWSRLGPTVEYVNASVDACNLEKSLSSAGFDVERTHGSLRMINLALHHFSPSLVKAIFSDVIRSNSALMVGDLAPNAGGILWNWYAAFRYFLLIGPDQNMLWSQVRAMPMWTVLLSPLIPLMGIHDAEVSVLRAYSAKELQDIVNSIPGGDKYEISVFYSKSYGEWFHIPNVLPNSGLNDPLVQYFMMQPAN